MLVLQIIVGVALGIVIGTRLNQAIPQNIIKRSFNITKNLAFLAMTWLILLGPFALAFYTVLLALKGEYDVQLITLSSVLVSVIYGPWIYEGIKYDLEKKRWQREFVKSNSQIN